VGATSFVGYALSKQEFWHRKFWYRFVIITMYLSAGVVPTYMNYKMLGLLNNLMVYVIPGMVSAYNVILVKTYMESISPSLEESALLDGAGYLVRYFRVVLPLCKPIIATIAVFKAVNEWSAYMDTIMYMSGGKYETLQSLLYRYLNQATQLSNMLQSGGGDYGAGAIELNPVSVRYTLTFITVLPILCVYPYFQRFFVKGIMIGAVKG
jgi:ABC-type glycerol-3-phosphate transport system permease component